MALLQEYVQVSECVCVSQGKGDPKLKPGLRSRSGVFRLRKDQLSIQIEQPDADPGPCWATSLKRKL
ncbi:hypothetical protein Q5P01_011688 [Channa striata]|uniref:Uncharacterized protein n=1 Tax=Channa striata TaxID=64152 RepID=A0AA88MUU6_CHASR|nr:hypothetical protein Q5P01_011688 [Channa striata]